MYSLIYFVNEIIRRQFNGEHCVLVVITDDGGRIETIPGVKLAEHYSIILSQSQM